MWSKQADMSNKNVTSSFKNKITNRKRRNSKSSNPNNSITAPSTVAEVNNKSVCEANDANNDQMKQKSKKNRKSCSSNLLNKSQNDETLKNSPKTKTPVSQKNNKNKCDNLKNVEPDVVLRNVVPSTDLLTRKNIKDDVIKRFSDSFIVENGRGGTKKPCDTVDGVMPQCDKTKKNRRFSDLFKSSNTMSGSVEDFKLLPDKVLLRQNSELCLKKNNEKNEMQKGGDNKNCSKEISDSYLKRVKSKIYKSTKGDAVNGDKKTKLKKCKDTGIPEECEHELRKSSSNFDFRLLRQTSNLEGIWPLRSNCEKSDGTKTMDSLFVKPTLEKAKSSSAINLNLLRTRRNKIMEQVKKRNCQEAKNEFDFVGFGNVLNDSLLFSKRLSSSQTHVGDAGRRLPPSWLHETIGNEFPFKFSFYSLPMCIDAVFGGICRCCFRLDLKFILLSLYFLKDSMDSFCLNMLTNSRRSKDERIFACL
ncbi:hypothetical protein WA026_014557 [Henosepilachna vigintioctopunctata]|uniref:Uncharacterized protein n=1 Tax=Henosepilachna vigintioctopunctata TaxID=420089 RepID=A0AAW1VCE9_9CUCU